MINISRRHPWALWPNSICPAFLDKPAVDRLQGDQYWKIDITFSYNEVNNLTATGACMSISYCASPLANIRHVIR